MKIAVLGSNGQLGKAICTLASTRGDNVIGFSREQLDITDTQKCETELKKIMPESIINCAAYHLVPECEKNPDRAFLINTIAQKNLSLIAKDVGAVMVYISTDKVFDGKTSTPYNEEDRTNPLQMYGLSKLAGELVTLNTNPTSYVVRTNGVYGGVSGSRVKKGNFVLYILNEAKNKKELEISSDQYANFVYADDLATAILDLVDKKAPYGVYHLVNDGYAPWAEFAQEIVIQSGLALKIIPINRSGVYSGVPTPGFCVLDITKAQTVGIHMPLWKQALGRYLQFLRTTS